MSTQHIAPFTLSAAPAQQPNPSRPTTHDSTPPYADLIDQYAVTYKAHSSAPLDGHGNDDAAPPMYPLSMQQSNYSDVSFKDAKDFDPEPQRLDWGYPPTSAKPGDEQEHWQDRDTRGTWEILRAMFIPDSLACRLYLLAVLVETSIDLAFEAEIFLRLEPDHNDATAQFEEYRKMPVYLAIFAMAHVFQFCMALDAVYARNTLQFIALSIFNALLMVYAIIQITEVGSVATESSGIPIHTLTTVIPIVIAVAQIVYMGLGWQIYREFGWKVYKFLGADRRIKTMFAYYQIFLCLVKFDLFFWVGFSVQFIWLVLYNTKNAEYYLTYLALPLSIFILIIGHLGARRENKILMLTFMAGCASALVYFTYKLVKVLRLHDTSTYIYVWQTLTTFSVLAILLLVTTFVFSCLVMHNFGRGLAKQISKNTHRTGKSQDLYRGPMSAHPNRMSIE